jgi:hypothetical protein
MDNRLNLYVEPITLTAGICANFQLISLHHGISQSLMLNSRRQRRDQNSAIAFNRH